MPNVTGFLVPPGDASAFSVAVRNLIAGGGRRAVFAEAARQRVKAEHDVSTAARRLDEVIAMVRQPGCAIGPRSIV